MEYARQIEGNILLIGHELPCLPIRLFNEKHANESSISDRIAVSFSRGKLDEHTDDTIYFIRSHDDLFVCKSP